jgi:hypothetical protein
VSAAHDREVVLEDRGSVVGAAAAL